MYIKYTHIYFIGKRNSIYYYEMMNVFDILDHLLTNMI